MESLVLSQKDAQSKNKWRRRIKRQLANPGSPGKMAVKMECVECVTLIPKGTPSAGVQNTQGWEKLRFSTKIAVYLGNGTR